MSEALIDSNVLIYAMSDAPAEREKRERARELLARTDFGTSYQVLMETWVTVTRKIKVHVPEAKAVEFLELIAVHPVVECGADLWRSAVLISKRYRIHPYDAAIVAAAHELQAATLYSEDLATGQDYDGVRVVNPFKN